MNQREYESALKDLLETVTTLAEEHYPETLAGLYMPQNVPGARQVNLIEWLDARFAKREKNGTGGFTGGKWDEKSLGL